MNETKDTATNKAIRVVLDAMGGDHAPEAVIAGALEALANEKISVTLVGKMPDIEHALAAHASAEAHKRSGRLQVINATEVITTDESPTVAIRQKKDSSLVVGLKLLSDGKADAFVSAGNTGALLTGATLIVGRVKGIERPALGTLLPNDRGFSFLIDSGANVDAKPAYLVQFGKMGAMYMETVLGMQNPRVGLVNIGAEKEKGNALTKEAYILMESADINFVGNVEAREISSGAADVIVCDAFTGNVLLKYTEGFASTLFNMVKAELMATTMSKIGAFMAQSAFRRLKKRFEYDDIGGAPFLGLNGLVVKAHGSSNARAIKGAVGQCIAFVENDFIEKLREKL